MEEDRLIKLKKFLKQYLKRKYKLSQQKIL